MKIVLIILAVIVLIPVLVVAAAQIGIQLPAGEAPVVEFATVQRPSTPNTYLVAPAGVTSIAPDAAAPEFDVSPTELKARWERMAAAQPRVVKVGESQDGQQLDYVQRTRLVRYPDFITVRFLPLEGGRSTLAVYSRSVYGHGDMGVNKSRVTEWLKAL